MVSQTAAGSARRSGAGGRDRITVVDVRPQVDGGARAARAVPGETLEVSATVFTDGRAVLVGEVVLRGPAPGGKRRRRVLRVPMSERVPGTDRFVADVAVDAEGLWTYHVTAWVDPLATWLDAARLKIPAGVDCEQTLLEGAALLERAARVLCEDTASCDDTVDVLRKLTDTLRDPARPPAERLAELTGPAAAALERHPLREHVVRGADLPLRVDRERALFGSWYEFFPRSEGARTGDGVTRSGTFRTAAQRLDAVAAMGFDVVYLPPVHPIGHSRRKGPGNSLTAGPDDPGSPWAIGSAAGGHDTVHPDLGSLDDFRAFVDRARALGLEIALDFALQCSPDHPWVTEHPEWFAHRPDGSIAHAENPPKQYQDIYPLSFETDPDGIHRECLRILRHWMALGVRIFRVDNPHTKPLFFWERLLAEVRASDPDVLFLAEAFTRPPMLQALARIGFHQSYTYFTWRTGKTEIEAYLSELAGLDGTPAADYLRPNLFVNTPDILPAHLVDGGRAAFAIRAVLAATAGPTWGVYAGFELYEAQPAAPGSEEYKDSEKYQYRPRDHAAAEAAGDSLAPLITRLNRLRRQHPALRRLRNLRFHRTDNDHVICFSKRAVTDEGEDTVLVVLSLDPHRPQRARLTLDTEALGLGPTDTFLVHDVLGGGRHRWGRTGEVRFDPAGRIARVLTVRPNPARTRTAAAR